MFQYSVTFITASVIYGVVIGGPITKQYYWQTWDVVAASPTNNTWSNDFQLPKAACGYAITAKSSDPSFDVSFQMSNIEPGSGLWTYYNWTGGPWTLYVGAQILNCPGQKTPREL